METPFQPRRLTPMQRLRVLVSGSYMEVQRTANQEPFVKFSSVPIAVMRSSEAICKIAAIAGIENFKWFTQFQKDLKPEGMPTRTTLPP